MENKIFDQTKRTNIRSSAFDLTHDKKISFNAGYMVPAYFQEILPGDYLSVNSHILVRLSPMVAPIMQRINVYMHYFFVPNRLLWDEWEDFATGGREGLSKPTMPTIDWNPNQPADGTIHYELGSLGDYLGLPIHKKPSEAVNVKVSQLPFRAYTKIYNEYFRDQNLIPEIDETNTDSILHLRKRAWAKDYFTSLLPWTQRGDSPEIPINVDNEMTVDGTPITDSNGEPTESGNVSAHNESTDKSYLVQGTGTGTDPGEPININIDAAAFGMDVNELRRTIAIQRWLEKQATGGGRLTETLYSQFGVKTSDARIQRAEYLGGGVKPVSISEVLNTSATATAAQGNLSGYGISAGGQNKFSRAFEEHGFVIGIMSVLPKASYQQGVDRLWKRDDKFDYYWPEFANLGEQKVRGEELYSGTKTENDKTLGYSQRFAEYKYAQSTVHGEFRESLNHWHWGRIFENSPELNATFTNCDPGNRIFAVTTNNPNQLLAQVYNQVHAIRKMPFFADPKLT